MFSSELLQAYLNTTYQVGSCNVKIRIGLIDEHLEKILDEKSMEEWAFITAFNPYSVLLTDEENYSRHQQLQRDVSSFIYFDGEGVGEDITWKPEKSFLILGLNRESAIELGLKYNQNAIVFGIKGQPAELLVLMKY